MVMTLAFVTMPVKAASATAHRRLGRAYNEAMRRTLVAGLLALAAACGDTAARVLAGDAGPPAAGGVAFVQLFEWKWTDVARECETYLGPKGFTAVQISPPNEHAWITSGDGAPYP
jgi:alpha-amylase